MVVLKTLRGSLGAARTIYSASVPRLNTPPILSHCYLASRFLSHNRGWDNWATQPVAGYKYTKDKSTFPKPYMQFYLMKFLQYHEVAKLFTDLATHMIHRGKTWRDIVDIVIRPLSRTFFAGVMTQEAIKNAVDFLAETQQQILLNYSEAFFIPPINSLTKRSWSTSSHS